MHVLPPQKIRLTQKNTEKSQTSPETVVTSKNNKNVTVDKSDK